LIFGPLTSGTQWEGEMKRKTKREIEKFDTVEKYVWESIRRNDGYKGDFKEYAEADTMRRVFLRSAWGFNDGLPNPDSEYSRGMFGQFDPEEPFIGSRWIYNTSNFPFEDISSSNDVVIKEPGEILVREVWLSEKEARVAGASKTVKEKFDKWVIWNEDKQSCETMNKDNCPRGISLFVEVNPSLRKQEIKNRLLREFETAYKKLVKAQRLFLKKIPRSRVVGLDKCFDAYDLKKSRKSLKEIATELYKPDTEKELERSIERVRKQIDTADRLINHKGWFYLWGGYLEGVKIPF
jgi:hypothetical protein